MANWTSCDSSSFNIERHLIVFLQENAFYAELSRHIRKVATTDENMPTAAVAYDIKNDELCMYYNPIFFGGGTYQTRKGETVVRPKLSNWEVRGVIQHELDHIVFGHLYARKRTPHDTWNIATDLAINSLIIAQGGSRKEDDLLDARPLPKCGLIPGQRPIVEEADLVKMTPARKKALEEFCDIIEKFPKEKASEWYFDRLIEIISKKKQDGSDPDGEFEAVCGVQGMDNHDGWENISDEMREYIEGKIKAIVEKAVRAADSQSNGWGNISASVREEIRRSISTIVNWRAVTRQFVGKLVRGERATSIKRINRRYPYIHPGLKRGYTARLCIAIDQSGSVDDTQLNMFFAELASLTKRVTVDILPFDCYADEKDIFEWRKGTIPALKRVRGGGTDFNAPTNLVNSTKNRGRWDGLLIMTDGECCAPGASRIRRGWVLSKGHKLEFPSNEIQIFLDDAKPMSGAWRLTKKQKFTT